MLHAVPGLRAYRQRTLTQLEGLIATIDPGSATPDQQAQFVADVERVLIAQNQGWTDLLSPRPAQP